MRRGGSAAVAVDSRGVPCEVHGLRGLERGRDKPQLSPPHFLSLRPLTSRSWATTRNRLSGLVGSQAVSSWRGGGAGSGGSQEAAVLRDRTGSRLGPLFSNRQFGKRWQKLGVCVEDKVRRLPGVVSRQQHLPWREMTMRDHKMMVVGGGGGVLGRVGVEGVAAEPCLPIHIQLMSRPRLVRSRRKRSPEFAGSLGELRGWMRRPQRGEQTHENTPTIHPGCAPHLLRMWSILGGTSQNRSSGHLCSRVATCGTIRFGKQQSSKA